MRGLRLVDGWLQIEMGGEWFTVRQACSIIGLSHIALHRRVAKYRDGRISYAELIKISKGDERDGPERDIGPHSVRLGRQTRHKIAPLWRRALCDSRRSHAAHERC